MQPVLAFASIGLATNLAGLLRNYSRNPCMHSWLHKVLIS